MYLSQCNEKVGAMMGFSRAVGITVRAVWYDQASRHDGALSIPLQIGQEIIQGTVSNLNTVSQLQPNKYLVIFVFRYQRTYLNL